jgi:hypothetical protein
LKVEYISVMAQAQRAIGTGAIERLAGFVGNLAAVKPEVLDKFDADQSIDEYAEMLGVPPKIVVSDDQVAEIRQQRAEMEQQHMQMQQAQAGADVASTGAQAVNQGAQAAKVLSEADTEGNNVLANILGGMQ